MAVLIKLENATNLSLSENNTSNGSVISNEKYLDLALFGKIFAGIDICLALFIIGGNMLVLIAVYMERKLHTIPNTFIASLAVADLLVGLVMIPLYVPFYLKVPHVEEKKYLCIIRIGSSLYSCGSSLLNLLLMSFDRYLAVIYPLRYNALMTPKRAKLALLALWVFITLLSYVPLFIWNRWQAGKMCDLYTVMVPGHIYISVHFLVLGCLTFTTLLYLRIFYTAHSHRKQIQATCTFTVAATRRREKEFKSAKLMSLILLLFVLFWLPYMACSALKFIKALSWDMVEVLKSFALCLSLSNSMVNPIVYAFLKNDFKRVFRKILFQRFCCNKMNGMTDARSANSSQENSGTDLSTFTRNSSSKF